MLDRLIGFLSSGENLVFFVFSLVAICGAIFMISLTRVVHMVMALALTFLSLGGIYITLGAEFVGWVQVLIYAGAITILMIFGIMMTRHRGEAETEPQRPWHNGLLLVGAIVLFGILFYVIQNATITPQSAPVDPKDNTLQIGQLLFNQYVIPFEIMSVLLTVAFIGAIVVAKREED
ncbi:NADH:ubiquinone oxidoreductase subunit J [Gordoniibacillus kamchatkensis]|uniref:NADH-quinone oxidoreductase subunit J n=1 Tax=Gordoniibacillus kamchatkensis TaxID=1590651 RepID=A0ABR5AIR6_9BACL|nr:NADH-quinone oxidoreductase subunit J [Paenibacillus sp. VKM B-2647]KIL40623.1 NADH:ubiquinone oxidoreductase subunit J [Paenibacillus sp. VKM B-2647]